MSSESKLNIIYRDWLKSLSTVNVISKCFGKLSSNQERVNYVIGLLRNNPTKLFLDGAGKNNNVSKELRETGNKRYAISLFDRALEYYTKSIAHATNESNELALALGNRAACLLNLGRIAEALVDVSRAVSFPNLDSDYRDKLLKRQEVCINRIIESKEPNTEHKMPAINKKSKFFDNASEKIALADSDTKGRNLVARDFIKTGEVLVIEQPFSSVLLPSNFYTHCSCCFSSAVALVECPECSTTMYCSTDCLNRNKKRHAYECMIKERLVTLGIEKMEFLALRILLDTVFEGHNVSSLMEISNKTTNEGKYESLDVRRIFDLVGNTEKRSVTDLFRRAFTAATIIEALRQFTTFFEEVDITESAAGGFILHFLQSLPCNAHEVTEMIGGDIVEIGAGAYATLSLLNHSCEPNVVRHSIGKCVVLRAIRPIKAGEEIVDNYGYHYATHERSERLSALMAQYYFQCQCEACLGNWPLYADIPNTFPKLKSSADTDLTQKYQIVTTKFEEHINLVLENKISKETIDFLCLYLDFLDVHLSRPWQNFNKCQEAIKHGLHYSPDFSRNDS